MAEVRSVEVARVLVSAGADPLVEDDIGQQALYFAAMYGDAELVRFFLDAGCDPVRTDFRGQTPAWIARRDDHPEVAAMIEQWATEHP